MITHYFKAHGDKELQVIPEPRTGVWTQVIAPSEEEIVSLIVLYGLDETIMEDIEDVFEVPRFEQVGAISYFFTRYPYDVQDIDIETAPILIILGESFLITISQQEVPFIDPFVEGRREFITTQKTRLFLDLLAALTVAFDRKLTRIRKMVYRDMGRVRSIRGKEIQRLVFFEQEMNETIAALVPTNAWLNQLTKGNYIQMFSEDREKLDDLLIDNSQLVESAKSVLKTIQNIRGASDALLTQNLNATIRALTAFTIVLTIPTLIASLFGMNVHVPLENNPFAFWIIVGLIVTIVSVTVHFFMRNRWM